VQVYLLKADTVSALQHFVDLAPLDSWIECLVTDQGGEYMSVEACEYLQSKSVEHTTMPAHTPEFNGVVERFNQMIMNMVRCLLHDSGLDHNLWGEALHTAMIIYNHLPHCVNGGKSPLHVWSGEAPLLEHIWTFGCQAHLLVPNRLCCKLDDCL